MEGATGIVVGDCRLEQELGRGGAGIVYRARQLGVNRAVAVKLIPVSDNPLEATERFEREAQAAGALDHPHCLPVYAAGEQDGLLYLVMRLVNGPDLFQLIRREGPLEPDRAVALLEQVAAAVDHAHRAGLVHRDLKPANILIEPDGGVGHAYVSDFGLMRGLADSPITITGQWVGTPQFAAPEQQRGEPVGPAADIYALGRVLDQMLGTERPSRLAPVLARAMASDPTQRYPTAGALAAAARTAVGASRRATPRPSAARPSAARTVAMSTSAAPDRRLRRAVALGLVGVIVAAAVVVAVALLAHHSAKPPVAVVHRHAARLTTAAYRATLPAGWVITTRQARMSGYVHSVVQDPSGTVVVDIDRNTAAGQTLSGHAATVEAAAAQQGGGYRLASIRNTTLGGTAAIVWTFSLSGAAGQKVDVFRQVGSELFAVLASSDSSAESHAAATTIAASIILR